MTDALAESPVNEEITSEEPVRTFEAVYQVTLKTRYRAKSGYSVKRHLDKVLADPDHRAILASADVQAPEMAETEAKVLSITQVDPPRTDAPCEACEAEKSGPAPTETPPDATPPSGTPGTPVIDKTDDVSDEEFEAAIAKAA